MIGNHRLTIQSKQNISDGEGGYLVEWIDTNLIWATVKPVSGNERLQYMKVGEEITHTITMRYNPDIKAKQRLKFNNRILEIKSIINVEELNRQMELLCFEVVGLHE